MIDCILSDWLWQFSSDFKVDRTCTTSHVIILFVLRHKPYPIDLVIRVQFHFKHKAGLYDWSCYYPVLSSSLNTHYYFGLNSSIFYFIEITPIQLFISLSWLLFMIKHILSDWSWQFSFDFCVDHTCIISHIIVLPSLHHKPHPIGSIIIVQFYFWCRMDLTIDHVIVLSCLCHRRHIVPWALIVQYCFM